jgi:transcription elongation factor SPT4
MRSQRACMVCSYVQSGNQFQREGCPNCEDFLEMRGSSETVQDCTSAVFEGTITLNDVNNSWVAKWQRLEGCKPGIYAIKIEGNVSISCVDLLGLKE